MNPIIEATNIKRAVDWLVSQCGDDASDMLPDFLEGETDLHKLITRLHEGIANDAGMVTGIKERKADLDTRQKRLEARIDAQKGAIVMLMQAGKKARSNCRKLPIRYGTASLNLWWSMQTPCRVNISAKSWKQTRR